MDSLSFLSCKLDDIGKNLEDDKKINLKKYFKNKFYLVENKLPNFCYNYVNKNNLHETELPSKHHFDNILTMNKITYKEYHKVLKFYKRMKFENVRQYLECYIIADVLLLFDCFNHFRNMMVDKFNLDCLKYTSAPSYTKDCCLLYSRCKIETIQNIDVYNFIKRSISGGLSNSLNLYIKLDNDNQMISYIDINSMYPYSLSKKFPTGGYRFINIEEFDQSKYGDDKDYNCFLLCDVKTTDIIKNDHLYSQCPMLVSKCTITDKHLSEYQLQQLKNKRQNNNTNYSSISEKLILNLGSDSNCYLNFRMYKMMLEAGYDIEIKKILEFRQDKIFKKYIEDLYEMKKESSLQNKKAMGFMVKIM